MKRLVVSVCLSLLPAAALAQAAKPIPGMSHKVSLKREKPTQQQTEPARKLTPQQQMIEVANAIMKKALGSDLYACHGATFMGSDGTRVDDLPYTEPLKIVSLDGVPSGVHGFVRVNSVLEGPSRAIYKVPQLIADASFDSTTEFLSDLAESLDMMTKEPPLWGVGVSEGDLYCELGEPSAINYYGDIEQLVYDNGAILIYVNTNTYVVTNIQMSSGPPAEN